MKTYTLTESELQELLRQQREICAKPFVQSIAERIRETPSPPTEEVGIKEDDLQTNSCTIGNSIQQEIQSVCNEVGSELLRAKTLFPEKFVNQHEAYAVILEEIDELWDGTTKNRRSVCACKC